MGTQDWGLQDAREAIHWSGGLALCGDFQVIHIEAKVHTSREAGLDLRSSQSGITYSLEPRATGPCPLTLAYPSPTTPCSGTF